MIYLSLWLYGMPYDLYDICLLDLLSPLRGGLPLMTPGVCALSLVDCTSCDLARGVRALELLPCALGCGRGSCVADMGSILVVAPSACGPQAASVCVPQCPR